ncbi:hypothetical protein [Pseudomonas sp. BMS12]|uniref:hypothetical protein n=1 Tax=Pseudomonas sp. BMS12 TaxID=1796033 RepID=UPI0012902EE0|nr:hypothetical protein [Pseudomonas sp. BMS12]
MTTVLRVIGRLLYRGFMLCLWLLLLLYVVYKLVERSQTIAALPAQLEVEGVLLVGSGCGVAVLRMSPALRVRLQREGLATLQAARQARGHPGSDYYRYGPWQATPIGQLEADSSSPIMPGLQCTDIDAELTSRIIRASQEEGGYYSDNDGGTLLLLPREGMIVYGYFG